MTEITMPRLSDSMEEGTILSWLLADGDEVSEGQELAEIETDKATVTFEAPASGTLEIVVAAGGSVAVGATIARVGAAAAKDAARAAEPPEAPDTAAVPAAEAPPAEATPAAEAPPAEATRAAEAPPAEATPAPAASNGNGRVRATPLARRLAAVHGVDLAALRGTGPGGRIGKADVAQAAGIALAPAPGPVATPRAGAPAPAAPSGSAPAAGAPARADSAKGEVTVIVPGRLKAIVARRMSEAKATVPDFQVEAEADVTAALDMRAELKRVAPDRAPSLNDFVVKACALALRDHPRVNGSYRDGAFELYGRINVGIAVAGDDALVVPTVFDADRQSLGAIAAETRRLAGRVRSGEVSPSELSGATFTVSNLGMFGMSAITPVINPPQAAILGVGAARTVLARLAGEIVERSLMTLRLTGDHRILDGADAARFLADVVAGLQAPLALAL